MESNTVTRITEHHQRHFIRGSIPVSVRYTERVPLGDRRPGNAGDLIRQEEDVLVWRMPCDEGGALVSTYHEGGYDFISCWWHLEKGGGGRDNDGWEWTHAIESAAKAMAAGQVSKRVLSGIRYLNMEPVTITARK